MMSRVVFDACVLYSAPLRGFLLNLATDKLLEPFWSEEIQNEWTRSLLKNRPDLERENLELTCRKMDLRFPNGLVRGYETLVHTLQLPDPNDRHVLAVAIHSQSSCIVTFNLSDFPTTVLESYKIEAMSPDDFVSRLIQQSPQLVLRATWKHRSDLTRPPKTARDYLATLAKQKLPKTVAFLREHESDI